MKKIVSLIMIVLLTGCGGGALSTSEKDIYEIYENAIKNLSENDSYEINSNIVVTIRKDSETKNANIASQIQAENNCQDFHYTIGSTNIYYKDGSVYTSIGNVKVKAALPKLIMNTKNIHIVSKLSKKSMLSGTEKATNNGKELTLEFSATGLETIINKLNLDKESNTKIESIESGTVTVVMNVDNNNILTSQSLNFDIVCIVKDKNAVTSKLELVVTATEGVNGVNSTTIAYPSDLNNYKSLDIDKIKEFLTEFGII